MARVGQGWGAGRGKTQEGDDKLASAGYVRRKPRGNLIDYLEGPPSVQYDALPTEMPRPKYKRLF